MGKLMYDSETGTDIPMPIEMENFLNDIEEVCKKHNLSISHEDGHGSFIIDKYDSYNIGWLNAASKGYK